MQPAILAALALQVADQPPPVAAPPAPPQAADEAKVVSYPAGFFAPYRPNTALDMLRRLPGFSIDAGGGLRGFAGGEGNVRLDGQLPASRGDGLEAILERLPAAAVERIDLVTGGAGGIDMQGKSIIANIVRKPDLGRRTTVTLGANIFEDREDTPTVRLENQWSDGARLFDGLALFSQDVGGGRGLRQRGFGVLTRSDFIEEQFSEEMRLSGAYETPLLDGRLRLNASVSRFGEDSRTADLPHSPTPAPSLELGDFLQQTGEAGARYTRTLSGGTALEASLFHQMSQTDTASDFSQGAARQGFFGEIRSGEDIVRLTLRRPRQGAWTIDGGIEGTFNWLDTQSRLTRDGAEVPLPNSQVEVEELRGEAFATAIWTLSPAFNLQFGLRYEASTIETSGAAELRKTLNFFKPRIIATWVPGEGRLVVLRLERTVDQLSFGDFSASASLINAEIISGNPNLLPAENLIAEARYEHRFAERGALVLSYTHREIDNAIGRTIFLTPGGFIEVVGNIGHGERQNVRVALTSPLDRLGLRGGFIRLTHDWRTSEIVDPVTGERRRFSGDQSWSRSLVLSQDIPDSRWRWEATVADTASFINFLPREISVQTLDPYWLAHLEYRPSPRVTWRFEVTNITDRWDFLRRTRFSAPRDVGVPNFVDLRDLRLDGGGRQYRLSWRKTF